MVPHYRSLDELIANAPKSGRLGGPDATSGMYVYAYVEVLGETWQVNWETHVESLVKLRDFIERGGDPIRITDGGRRALGVGDDAKYLYVYAKESNGGTARKAAVATTQASCCSVSAPIGSECIICGNTVEAPAT